MPIPSQKPTEDVEQRAVRFFRLLHSCKNRLDRVVASDEGRRVLDMYQSIKALKSEYQKITADGLSMTDIGAALVARVNGLPAFNTWSADLNTHITSSLPAIESALETNQATFFAAVFTLNTSTGVVSEGSTPAGIRTAVLALVNTALADWE